MHRLPIRSPGSLEGLSIHSDGISFCLAGCPGADLFIQGICVNGLQHSPDGRFTGRDKLPLVLMVSTAQTLQLFLGQLFCPLSNSDEVSRTG